MANNFILLELEDHPGGLSGEELASSLNKPYAEVCIELVDMAEASPPLVLLKGTSGKWIIASRGRRQTARLRRNWNPASA